MKHQSCAFLLSCAVVLGACGNNANKEQSNSDTSVVNNTMQNDTGASSNMTNNPTPATATVTLDTMDKTFAMNAVSGGMSEIEMANLALQNSKNDRVKAFANMMITDHGKANDDLKALAANKGLTLPAQPMPEHLKHMDMLKGKTGSAFDKAYMSHMVMDHEKDVAEFEKASTNARDADIKSFASRTLPILKTHLDSAKAISKAKM